MKIGIAAATAFEIQPVIGFIGQHHALRGHTFQILITGIGTVAATYHLTRYIYQEQPDCLLQAGIGGTFTDTFPPGDVVMIKEEIIGDLGVEEQGFKDLFDMGLMQPFDKPFTHKVLPNPYLTRWEKFGLPAATGITVNEITTLPQRIRLLQQKYHGEIESMEGAALHYVCLQQHIPFLQCRAVSNAVGERDKTKWQLKTSVDNLNQAVLQIIQQI